MGLLVDFGEANLVCSAELAVRYSVSQTSEGFEATRYATRVYDFVGMTKEAAMLCAELRRAQYTREFSRVQVVETVDAETGETRSDHVNVPIVECASDIVAKPQSGEMWMVSVSVNETDVRFSADRPNNLDTLFVDEGLRNYDNDWRLVLIGVDWRKGWQEGNLEYSQKDIDGFDQMYLEVECKASVASVWEKAPRAPDAWGWAISEGSYYRLVYSPRVGERVTSNVVKAI